jgi:hypothetical protein
MFRETLLPQRAFQASETRRFRRVAAPLQELSMSLEITVGPPLLK